MKIFGLELPLEVLIRLLQQFVLLCQQFVFADQPFPLLNPVCAASRPPPELGRPSLGVLGALLSALGLLRGLGWFRTGRFRKVASLVALKPSEDRDRSGGSAYPRGHGSSAEQDGKLARVEGLLDEVQHLNANEEEKVESTSKMGGGFVQ
ncbi:hypothetical protein PG996_004151 [Apiospora saccharicola]|uniref:Uncharacterized protein n=1 Tax=Apiospora saccharicola TaxID=335842 RepID=A0ABR1W3D3_9PEZI